MIINSNILSLLNKVCNFKTMEKSKEHCLVKGYIKNFYDQYIITDIAKNITLWFGSRYDIFDEMNSSNQISISKCNNDGLMIKRIKKWDSYHYNAFGYNIISNGEIKTWTLKLIKTKPRFTSCIQIGIIQSNTINPKMQGSFCQMTHFNGYGVYAKNGRLFHGSYYCPHSSKYYRIPALSTGDVIKVTLDLSNKAEKGGSLTFNINDSKKDFKAFNDIDKNLNYVLAIALYALYDTVLLMNV